MFGCRRRPTDPHSLELAARVGRLEAECRSLREALDGERREASAAARREREQRARARIAEEVLRQRFSPVCEEPIRPAAPHWDPPPPSAEEIWSALQGPIDALLRSRPTQGSLAAEVLEALEALALRLPAPLPPEAG